MEGFNLCSIRLAQRLVERVEYSALYVLLKCLLYRHEYHHKDDEHENKEQLVVVNQHWGGTKETLRLKLPSVCTRFGQSRFVLYMRDVLVGVYPTKLQSTRSRFSHMIYLSHVYAIKENHFLMGQKWNYPLDQCVHLTSTLAAASLLIPIQQMYDNRANIIRCYIRRPLAVLISNISTTTTRLMNPDKAPRPLSPPPEYTLLCVDKRDLKSFKCSLTCMHEREYEFAAPLYDFIVECLEVFIYAMQVKYKKLGKDLIIRLENKHPDQMIQSNSTNGNDSG